MKPFANAILAFSFTLFLGGCATTQTSLIPRHILFADYEKAHARISPDGKILAYLSQDDGLTQLWIKVLRTGEESKLKTWNLLGRDGLNTFFWQSDSKHILFQADKKGDEDFHIFQINIESSKTLDLTPFSHVSARFEAMSPSQPDELLFSANVNNKELHDLYRVDLKTGAIYLEKENPGAVDEWIIDRDLKVRGGLARLPGRSGRHLLIYGADGHDLKALSLTPKTIQIRSVEGCSQEGDRLWVTGQADTNTSKVFEINLKTGMTKTLFEDLLFDVQSVLISPDHSRVDGALFNKEKAEWQYRPELKEHAEYLKLTLAREINVVSQDASGSNWIVEAYSDTAPSSYYLYNLRAKKTDFLFSNQPKLATFKLQEMKPISFKARDGMKIYGYLTLPTEALPPTGSKTMGPPPMVMLIHGGPWTRDNWGLNREVQWLANRGYAVMQVNYRGSTGFGVRYELAGKKEWGKKMQADLIDGKNWAVEQGFVDKERVCLFGMSYGGYATLAGLAFTPREFACGVSVAGISNLNTFYETIAPYWRPFMHKWYQDVGDPSKDKDELQSISPVNQASEFKAPLLLVHGKNDSRVSRNQSDEMFLALRKYHKQVIYLSLPDGGHSLRTPRYFSFLTAAEEFLAHALHGNYESPSEAGDYWSDLIQD